MAHVVRGHLKSERASVPGPSEKFQANNWAPEQSSLQLWPTTAIHGRLPRSKCARNNYFEAQSIEILPSLGYLDPQGSVATTKTRDSESVGTGTGCKRQASMRLDLRAP